MVQSRSESSTLIPGLPNDIASQILSVIPYSHHSRIKTTSKSWYTFLSSKTLTLIRHHLLNLSHLICIFPQDPSISSPYLFDPHNLAWRPLPPMPCNPNFYGLCNFTSISLGTNLYVLGGSLFDTRSFPIDRPSPSSSAFRFSFVNFSWDQLAPMLSPRGSFACVAVPELGQIVVAGGGSRHTLFGAAGSRMSSVERYDVGRDEWVALDGLPRYRAGCVGFLVDREFWVMGGYGGSRTISGVFPVDEYYRNAVVMDLGKNGSGNWREVGDMWLEGERARPGKIVVVEDYDCQHPGVFMLDNNDIFRYDMVSNAWGKESSVPKKAPSNSSCGFVALDGELHVMTLLKGGESTDSRRPRQQKRAGTLVIQIYHPRKKTWRSVISKPPLNMPLDFNTAIMCTIWL
ncbi:Galactose oxidase/kelch repeat superfamily protein [Euphorbia peplus]|nr:Galactose oxidase/kelch repeat superfamily protein [Euphorbia peplus]